MERKTVIKKNIAAYASKKKKKKKVKNPAKQRDVYSKSGHSGFTVTALFLYEPEL
jgi:hypothetical protein